MKIVLLSLSLYICPTIGQSIGQTTYFVSVISVYKMVYILNFSYMHCVLL